MFLFRVYVLNNCGLGEVCVPVCHAIIAEFAVNTVTNTGAGRPHPSGRTNPVVRPPPAASRSSLSTLIKRNEASTATGDQLIAASAGLRTLRAPSSICPKDDSRRFAAAEVAAIGVPGAVRVGDRQTERHQRHPAVA